MTCLNQTNCKIGGTSGCVAKSGWGEGIVAAGDLGGKGVGEEGHLWAAWPFRHTLGAFAG